MMLPRLNAAASELPGLTARLEMLRGAVNNRFVALDSASDAIASATLQGRIEQQAAGAGATIRSTESLAVDSRGSYRRIGIRTALSGSYQNIIEFLTRIDGVTPPLVVGDLQIRGIQQFGTTPNGRFEAQFDIYAFRKGDAAAETKP